MPGEWRGNTRQSGERERERERGSGHGSKLGLPDSFGHVHKLHEAVARQQHRPGHLALRG